MDVHGWSTCIGHVGKNYLSRHRHHHPALLSADRRRERSAGGRHCPTLREHYVIVAMAGPWRGLRGGLWDAFTLNLV